MTTTVKITLHRPGGNGDTLPANGTIECVPTLRRHIEDGSDDYIVLPARFTVRLGDALYSDDGETLIYPAEPGVGWAQLEPTDAGADANQWAWKFVERTSNGTTRYCLIPTSGSIIDYGDLQDVDPSTFNPIEPPDPAWAAALAVETARALAAEDGLDGRVDDLEEQAATFGDVITHDASEFTTDAELATEAGARADGDALNAQDITDEVLRAQGAEADLQADIDQNAQDIATEASRAQGIEGGLRTDVDATQAALADKADLVGGLVPTSQIPSIALGTGQAVANRAAMLALTNVQQGDFVSITATADKGTYILNDPDPSIFGHWMPLSVPTDVVQSVNGQNGSVVLGKSDVGLGSVDNTSDAGKPVSTAQAAAIAAEATLARNADNLSSGTVADARIASTIARDTEVTAAVAAEATLARNGDNITSGTIADARIASTITRDSEVSALVAAELAGYQPGLEIGYAERATQFTSTQVAANATGAITSLSVGSSGIIVGTGRAVDIRFACPAVWSSTANKQILVTLGVNGTYGGVTAVRYSPATTFGPSLEFTRRLVLTNGVSYTFTVALYGEATSGTCTAWASATFPMTLSVTNR